MEKAWKENWVTMKEYYKAVSLFLIMDLLALDKFLVI